MDSKYDDMKKAEMYKELDARGISGYKKLTKQELIELLLDDNPPATITKEYYSNKIKEHQLKNFNDFMSKYEVISVVYKVNNKGVEEKTVYQAKHKGTGDIVAIKHSINTPNSLREYTLETSIHKILMKEKDHSYFVKYIDGYKDSYQTILVSEFVSDAVELEEFIDNFEYSQADILNITKQLISGLIILHKYIVHRDIKPKNIMIMSNMKIKFIDFGSSCLINDKKELGGLVGTPRYYSPELVMHITRVYAMAEQHSKGSKDRYSLLQKYNEQYAGTAKYNQIADIWSLGQVIYRLANKGLYSNEKLNTKINLYKGASAFKILLTEAIVKESKFTPSANPNKKINDVVNGFLRYMPNERMSLEEGLKILT